MEELLFVTELVIKKKKINKKSRRLYASSLRSLSLWERAWQALGASTLGSKGRQGKGLCLRDYTSFNVKVILIQ